MLRLVFFIFLEVFGIIALVFLIAIVFALFLFIKIELVIQRSNQMSNYELEIYVFSFLPKLRYDFKELSIGKRKIYIRKEGSGDNKISLSIKKVQKNFLLIKSFIDDNHSFFSHIKDFIKRRLIFTKLKIGLIIGTDEAHNTAILTGAAWALGSNICMAIDNFFILRDVKLNIEPDFNSARMDIDVHCILKIKIVHIINVGFRILMKFLSVNRNELMKRNHKNKKIVGGGVNG